MGRPKGSKNKYKGVAPREVRECLGGCGLKREVLITDTWSRCKKCYCKQHNEGCTCSSCKMRRREFHNENCPCPSCKNKRGELHKEGCDCFSCAERRGEHHKGHKQDCTCYVCKAIRGEYKGADHPTFGRHYKMPEETKVKIGLRQKGVKDTPHSTESYQKGVETRAELTKQRGYYHSDETLSKILHTVYKNPSEFEIKLINYLNIYYPGQFVYTGDGSFVKGSRSADFYSEQLNMVILAQGDYYHCNPKKYAPDYYHKKREMTAQEIWDYDKDAIQRFQKAGYKVSAIWENELNEMWEKGIKEGAYYLPIEETGY